MVIPDALKCMNRAWHGFGEVLKGRIENKIHGNTYHGQAVGVREIFTFFPEWERLYLHEDLIYFQSNLRRTTFLPPSLADPPEEKEKEKCE
ncbi:hypothetical protein MKX03_008356 [Papaver bracteatum]|nr:hypothetical protein MKX03_008356 [Papaver bracteatum]